ncbi:MAG: hypothetical protein WDO13_06610 [Verrucomicrobiota bacterium]
MEATTSSPPDGVVFRTKTVLITTGVSYRTLGVTGLTELHGCGVYYAATRTN